jgi:[acyl-carrier-protein] S-malonyltransferase
LVEPVNFNAPNQVVTAGHVQAIDRLIELAKPAGAKMAVKLPVSAPFHSTLLSPVAAQLENYLKTVNLSSPEIQVINNVRRKHRAGPY